MLNVEVIALICGQKKGQSLSSKIFPKLGFKATTVYFSGAPNDNFRKNICSEDDLRSRIFLTFVVKFLASMPLLGFSNK